MWSDSLKDIAEPRNYYQGRGNLNPLPSPRNVLLFVRRDRKSLQQKALENRSHHRWVFIFNLGTTGQVHVDQRTCMFREEEAILVRPFQFHHFSHLESEQLTWLFCTFELDPSPVPGSLEPQPIRMDRPFRDTLDRLLAVWTCANRGSGHNSLYGTRIQTAVLDLLLEFGQASSAEPASLSSAGSESHLLEAINQLVTEHRNGLPTIARLAETLSMSPSGLRAKFRVIAGVSLGSYLQNHRIHRAMMLLRGTNESVGWIAAEVGYSSTPAFSRAFHTALGQTPLEYRNQADAG